MHRINILRAKVRRPGLLVAPLQSDLAANLTAMVQLWRPVPGIGRVPAPMLHAPGYVAAPYILAPRCRSGVYGRLVYVRADRPPPHRLCPLCWGHES